LRYGEPLPTTIELIYPTDETAEAGLPTDELDYWEGPSLNGATATAAGAIGGATIVLTKSAIVDYRTALIGLVALVLLLRFELEEPYLVRLAVLAGIALH
jgi:hypothetical protein